MLGYTVLDNRLTELFLYVNTRTGNGYFVGHESGIVSHVQTWNIHSH
jgi:hypothetical protein